MTMAQTFENFKKSFEHLIIGIKISFWLDISMKHFSWLALKTIKQHHNIDLNQDNESFACLVEWLIIHRPWYLWITLMNTKSLVI